LDWLPWNHTFGGNHNFGMVLHAGGTLYIDDGRPTPDRMGETIRNLREIAPTLYFNVPKGYEELAAAMRGDPTLRETFFSRLGFMFYSGASLAPHVRDGLIALSRAARGRVIPIITAFGATETAPAALANTHETAQPGNIGLPLPGVTLKLVASGDKHEARIAGPNVTPGYWREPAKTAAAFDEEGYYRLGDAMVFAEPGEPAKGFIFNGRIAEDFKLATGTWVNVGALRQRLIAALHPVGRDVVIAGHDRDDITALVLPDLPECRKVAGASLEGTAAVLGSDAVRALVKEALVQLSAAQSGSSMRVARVALLDRTLSIDAGEVTDKGSINQRAVLARHADLVEALYRAEPHPLIVVLAPHRPSPTG
jgi:feruloyl-CoA synthase